MCWQKTALTNKMFSQPGFARTYQDEWSDYSTWGIDKRGEDTRRGEELYEDLEEDLEEGEGRPVKRRLGSE